MGHQSERRGLSWRLREGVSASTLAAVMRFLVRLGHLSSPICSPCELASVESSLEMRVLVFKKPWNVRQGEAL